MILVFVGCIGAIGFIVYTSILAQNERDAKMVAHMRAEEADRHRLEAQRAAEQANEERDRADQNLVQANRNMRATRLHEEQAEQTQHRGEGLRLAGSSRAEVHSDPGLAMLLAIDSTRDRARLPAHNDALLESLLHCRERRTLFGHEHPVRVITCDHTSKRVFTAPQWLNSPRIWNSATGETIATLRDLQIPATSANFSPDGKRIVTTYEGNMNVTYVTRDNRGRAGSEVLRHAYTDRVARVWNTATGEEMLILTGHTKRVTSAQFSADGKSILTASHDGTAR